MQIETYQRIGALSARMVEAAQAHDWEQLVALEQSVAELRDALINNDDNAGLSAEEKSVKAALIQRILDDDAEIRRHTEPWMEHVRQFLGGARMKRQIDRAYGAAAL
jgi:flagellar protein FliT